MSLVLYGLSFTVMGKGVTAMPPVLPQEEKHGFRTPVHSVNIFILTAWGAGDKSDAGYGHYCTPQHAMVRWGEEPNCK